MSLAAFFNACLGLSLSEVQYRVQFWTSTATYGIFLRIIWEWIDKGNMPFLELLPQLVMLNVVTEFVHHGLLLHALAGGVPSRLTLQEYTLVVLTRQPFACFDEPNSTPMDWSARTPEDRLEIYVKTLLLLQVQQGHGTWHANYGLHLPIILFNFPGYDPLLGNASNLIEDLYPTTALPASSTDSSPSPTFINPALLTFSTTNSSPSLTSDDTDDEIESSSSLSTEDDVMEVDEESSDAEPDREPEPHYNDNDYDTDSSSDSCESIIMDDDDEPEPEPQPQPQPESELADPSPSAPPPPPAPSPPPTPAPAPAPLPTTTPPQISDEESARIRALWAKREKKIPCVVAGFFEEQCTAEHNSAQQAGRHVLTHIPDLNGELLNTIECTARCGNPNCTFKTNRVSSIARHVNNGLAKVQKKKNVVTERDMRKKDSPYCRLNRPWYWPSELFNGTGEFLETHSTKEGLAQRPPGETRTTLEVLRDVFDAHPALLKKGQGSQD